MPSSTLDDLLEAYTQVSARNRTILEEFASIARQFHEQGIAFIVLKGADIIARLYGVQGARPISDVDLLVHESDLATIDRSLRTLGFTQQIDGNPSYASPQWSVSLDVVTALWYLKKEELSAVWERASTRRFGTATMSCLETNDLLVYLTAYNVIHRGHLSTSFVQDMKLLMEKERPNWAIIIARAQQAGLRVPMFHGLSHVRKIWPSLPMPHDVLTSLAPATQREQVLAWLLNRLVTTEPLPEVGHLLLFLTQPGRSKVAWLTQRLFPSQIFLSYRYGPAGQTISWQTRVSRLSHLAQAILRLSRRVFHRLITAPARSSL